MSRGAGAYKPPDSLPADKAEPEKPNVPDAGAEVKQAITPDQLEKIVDDVIKVKEKLEEMARGLRSKQ